jgi:4-amino-4-deoxy-L-arabinose transferase-like glycosyltransferase
MNRSYKYIAFAVITLASLLAIASSWNDSVIVDEVPHIGAGYSYLEKQDMRLNPEHPPLAKDAAGFPLLFLGLNKDVFKTKFWQTDINGQWEFGRYLMFNSGNNADLIKHWAKIPMLLFFILAAILVFKWARKLYGNIAGLLALILFGFSPTIMAHARFVTTDVAALFGVLAATYFFIKYLHLIKSSEVGTEQFDRVKNHTTKDLIVAGLAFGVALLCKFSTILLVPYFGLLAVIWGFVNSYGFGKRLISAIKFGFISVFIFAIGFIFVVWPVYYFHTYNYPPERQQSDTKLLLSSYAVRPIADAVVWASDKPVLRAAAQYGLGLLMVSQRAIGGNTTYFLGEVSATGWHYYFPVVYFLKEPLAWWGLILIAILSIAIQFPISNSQFSKLKDWTKGHFEELAMLLWLVIYWATSIQSNLNIGVRHLLPVYGFSIILVSGQIGKIIEKLLAKTEEARSLSRKSRSASITLLILLTALPIWYVIENLNVFPYYLTYFNQVAGGPTGGYRYVADSNLDWGQDLLRLGKFVKENQIQKIETDYFGWADPVYYLGPAYEHLWSSKYLGADDFKLKNKSDGWMAISATFLQGSVGTPDNPAPINYLWLKTQKPVTVIGNSIFIYHIK